MRKVWLIVKKLKILSDVSCDDAEKKIIIRGRGILNIYINNKLEFMINNFCNICAVNLIIKCEFIFVGSSQGGVLY